MGNKPTVGSYYSVTGDLTFVKPKNGKKFTLEELQGYVEGYIEIVRGRNPDYVMVVNEDGIREELPLNKSASYIYGIPLLGNCVFLHKDLID